MNSKFISICLILGFGAKAVVGGSKSHGMKTKTKDISNLCPLITINKCNQNIKANFFHVPEGLQAPLSPKKYKNLEEACKTMESEKSVKSTENIRAPIFKFRLQENFHKCSENISDIGWVSFYENENRAQTVNKWKHGSYISRNTFFTTDGFLKVDNETSTYLSPDHYCINNITDESVQVQFCDPFPEALLWDNQVVIPKCCPVGSVVKLDWQNISIAPDCVEVEDPGKDWKPYMLKDKGRGKFKKTEGNIRAVFEHKRLYCDFLTQAPSRYLDGDQRVEFRVTGNGQVYTRQSGNHKWDIPKFNKKAIHDFCIDGVLDSGSSSSFERNEENQIMFICPDSLSTTEDATISYLYFSLMIVASIFLLLIVVVYALVWDKQNIHGWTIAAFSFTMMVYIMCQAAHHATGLFQGKDGDEGAIRIGSKSCAALGIFLHYAYIALFSWMTVLNFDLWSAIVSMAPTMGRDEEKKRFLCYNLFGYGIPLIAVSISVFIEFNYDYFDDSVVRPLYGQFTCDLDKTAYLYHAIIVNTILFLFDILFGCLTIRFLWSYRTQAQKLHKSQTQGRYNLANMFGKIFVLLGFTWIFEIMGWLITSEASWYLVAFDVYNLLQSAVLFWIFVCKKEIKHQLCHKYAICKRIFTWAEEKRPTRSETTNVTYDSASRHTNFAMK